VEVDIDSLIMKKVLDGVCEELGVCLWRFITKKRINKKTHIYVKHVYRKGSK